MFIGHFAVGLAAKKIAPKASLGTLFLSAQFIDLLWPIFLLIGLEHVRIDPGNTAFTPLDFYDYPISHSLLTVMGWAIGFGLVYLLISRYPKSAWVLALGVISHWLLDLVTHRPDLPLAPGSKTFVGLGLWNFYAASVLVELTLFVAGVIFYLRSTIAINRIGRYALWSLLAFLLIIWLTNMVSPPPPNEQAIAYASLLLWLVVPWAYWIDRHRRVAEKPE